MAHWIYVRPSSNSKVGSLSSYVTGHTTITGFPLHTSDSAYVLTADKPGTAIRIRSGREEGYTPILVDLWGGILVTFAGKDYTLFDHELDDSMLNPVEQTTTVLRNKLFRVNNSTSIDSYCTVYDDVEVFGKYRVRDPGKPFMDACIIPVNYLHNGILREGIGNYTTSTGRTLMNTTQYLAPKAITHSTSYSNSLTISNIVAGDLLDFGAFPQNVPSVLKTWLETNCDNITDAAEPLQIKMDSPNGTQLLTAGKACSWDIKIVPNLQTKTVKPSDISQTIVPDSGYAGLAKVIVSAMPNPGIITFTIDGAEYEAETDMNWGTWVNTSYNTAGFVVNTTSGEIKTNDGVYFIRTTYPESTVTADEPIVADYSYELATGGGSN